MSITEKINKYINKINTSTNMDRSILYCDKLSYYEKLLLGGNFLSQEEKELAKKNDPKWQSLVADAKKILEEQNTSTEKKREMNSAEKNAERILKLEQDRLSGNIDKLQSAIQVEKKEETIVQQSAKSIDQQESISKKHPCYLISRREKQDNTNLSFIPTLNTKVASTDKATVTPGKWVIPQKRNNDANLPRSQSKQPEKSRSDVLNWRREQ